ncbi:MAG: hypothetical protein J1E35_10460 [Lachnospiraceae bacterium]|nr:hypothetical protein [Lachnospiraceae bacterium]
MFEQLRKNSFKRTLLWSAILLIIGVTFSVLHAENAVYSITGYVDFTTLSPDEIKSQLVDIELRENYGRFMSVRGNQGSSTITDYYYIIYTGAWDDVDTPYKYMAIKVPSAYKGQMDKMAQNTYDDLLSAPITFYGKIKKLGSTETQYFNDFWHEVDFTAENIQELTMPYYIEVDRAGKTTRRIFYMTLFFGGLAMALWAVLRAIKASKGGYLKKIRQIIDSVGCSEYAVESDFNAAIPVEGNKSAKIGKLFIYHDIRSTVPRAIPTTNIAWAYQTTTTFRNKYGRSTGTAYSVTIFTADAKSANPKKHATNITVANDSAALTVLDRLATYCPWIILGHSNELKKMFNKERARFLDLKYNTVEHTVAVPVETLDSES